MLFIAAPVYSFNLTTLNFTNEHWPPYIIFDNSEVTGIDIDIAKKIANNLKAHLTVTKCDWYYCLKMMENGRVDIISAILKTPDRLAYLNYIEPPYILSSTKLFYMKNGENIQINEYADIAKLRIGVLKGSSYFDQFDKDKKLNKIEVLKTIQLLEMLVNRRIDAFIGTELVIDYFIRSNSYNGLLEKSKYRYLSKSPFYFAISKKSPYSKRLKEINKIMTDLNETGQIQTIIDHYQKQ